MRIPLLLVPTMLLTSCTLISTKVAEVHVATGDDTPLAQFPLRVELGPGLTTPESRFGNDRHGEHVYELETDALGIARIRYCDAAYDISQDKNSGLRSLFADEDPREWHRRLTIIPLKPLPEGSRITIPAPHTGDGQLTD